MAQPHKHRARLTRRVADPARAEPAVQGEVLVPPEYRADVKDYICESLMGGRPLEQICAEDGVPTPGTVRNWLNRDAAFKQQFHEALRVRVLTESHRLIDIADGLDGMVVREYEDPDNGTVKVYASEDVARSRLRVDTRLKILAKMEPAVWGDRVEVDHDVTGELAAMMAAATNKGHRLPNAS